MKSLVQWATTLLFMAGLTLPAFSLAQDSSKDKELIEDCTNAKAEFIKVDKLMQGLFDNSAGYVIFPNVGKGAVGVGGAAGSVSSNNKTK